MISLLLCIDYKKKNVNKFLKKKLWQILRYYIIENTSH